jgi:hypothetical protein
MERPAESLTINAVQRNDTDGMLEDPQLALELMEKAAACISVCRRKANGCPSLSPSLLKLASGCDSAILLLRKYLSDHHINGPLQALLDSTSTTRSVPGPEALHTDMSLSEGDWLAQRDDAALEELSHPQPTSRMGRTPSHPHTRIISVYGVAFPSEDYRSAFNLNGDMDESDSHCFDLEMFGQQTHGSFLGCGIPTSTCPQHSTSIQMPWGPERVTEGCLSGSYVQSGASPEVNFLSTVAPETYCPADPTVVPPDSEADVANMARLTEGSGGTETAATRVCAGSEEQAGLGQQDSSSWVHETSKEKMVVTFDGLNYSVTSRQRKETSEVAGSG